MSKTIDQKVVEMQFDNRQFERNVSTTISSVDKLKHSLDFTGATKGLENVGAATKKLDMSGVGSAVEATRLKFSALGVMGVTALANITNSAIEAGKKIVSALTIDPIMTGFQEYETQINAVQTILANTQSKGSTLSSVNAALQELNEYADQTIYNFTEMTRNIGTFTAAGVDLDKSVTSIKGIANLAAVSGSNAQQASTAMYQLSQALAAGRVSLMDWNSVVNAGMGGELFQNALKRTAEHFGTNVDAMIKKYGSFIESLTEGGWLTAEVLTETLTQLSGAYSEADLIAQGYTQEQAREIAELAQTAVDAATKVKTFSQLWDTLKESAQSGWTQTWQILIGDFEEAKDLLTELSETFGNIIQASADARNNLLYDAMTSNWKKVTDGITEAGLSADDFKDKVTEIGRAKVKNFDEIVKEYGSLEAAFKNGALSSDLLTEAMTKMVGTSEEIAKKTAELRGEYKTNKDILDALTKAGYSQSEIQELITKDTKGQTIALNDLTDAQLTSIGYTGEQIQKIRDLAKSAELAGGSLQGFIDNVATAQGRELLIDAIRVSLRSIIATCEAVGKAWRDVFPPMTSDQLLSAIKIFQEFVLSLRPSEEILDKIQRSFRGVFSVLSIGYQAIAAVVKAVASLLGNFTGLRGGILTVTATIGDWLYALDQAIKKADAFDSVLQPIVKVINGIVTAIKNAAAVFKNKLGEFTAPGLERLYERFSQIGDAAGSMGNGIGAAMEAIADAFANSKFMVVFDTLYNLAKSAFKGIITILGELSDALADSLDTINFNTIFDMISAGGIAAIAVMIGRFVSNITAPFRDVRSTFGEVVQILDNVKGCLEAYQAQLKAATLIKIATAVGILAASIVAISLIDSEKLAGSLAAITVLFGNLVGAMALFEKIGFSVTGVFSTTATMIALSTAILILASALVKIGQLDFGSMVTGLVGIAGLTAIVVALAKTLNGSSGIIMKGATQMVIFGVAMNILAKACISMASLNWNELARGLTGIGVLLAEVSLFLNKTTFTAKAVPAATGIVILASALKILASVCEDFAQMKWDEIGKGLAAIGAILAEVAIFTKLTANATSVLSTSVAMVALGAAMKIFASAMQDFSGMKWDELLRGLAGMAGVLTAVTVALNLMPPNMIVMGAGLLVVSSSLLVLAEVFSRFSGMSWEEVARGLVSLGGAIAILAIGLNAMTGTLAGSAALVIATGALAVLAPTLMLLSGMSWEGLAKSLIALAGAFTVIGVAGLLLTPIVPAILALAGSFALIGLSILGIGAGLLAAGAGLSALAVGITALVAAVAGGAAAIVAALTVIITGIADLIPNVVRSLGEGVIAFAEVIAEGAPAIGRAFRAILLTLIDLLVEMVPIIANGALELITGVLEALVTYSPRIVDAIFDFLVELVDKLAERLPELTDSIVNLFVEFFAGVIDALNGIDTGSLLKMVGGMAVITALMIALSALASLVPAAMAGVIGLGLLIAELTLVLAAVGAIAQIPGLDWLVNEGGTLLQSIGTAIGGFIGGIVGGIMKGVTSQFPQIAKDLSGFMENIQPFIEGAKTIDPSVMDGVKNLAGAILALTGANLLDSITTFITGGSSLSKFAEQLIPFGNAMKEFSLTIAGMDANLVTNAALAGKALTEMAATIPNSGGLVSFFSGDNNMTDFGMQLVPFGLAMKNFSIAIAGMDANAVINAAAAGKALTEMASTIPNCGGLVSFFTGENDMATFGQQLISFGSNFAAYSAFMMNVDAGVVVATANAADSIVKLANSLPKTGGLFSSETTLGAFGKQLADFGSYFAKYYSYISVINPTSLSSVIDEMWRLIDMAKGMTGIDSSAMSTFGQNLTRLGQAGVSNFVKSFTDATSKVNTAVSSMLSALVKAVESKKSTLDNAFNKLMTGVIKTINNKKSDFTKSGEAAITHFTTGAQNKRNSTVTTFVKIVSECLSEIRSQYNSFRNAGIYLVDGFAKGIGDNTWKAVEAAKEMARQVTRATENVLQINSPSKAFYGIGDYTVLGLVNGIKDKLAMAEKTSSQLGLVILRGIQETLGIHSPSVVMNEQGHYIVQGIAEGITEDMSAEEAAAQKAQNIVNAFKTELDKLDLNDTTSDLEYKLWSATTGKGASSAEQSAAEVSNLQKKLKSQSERVKLAQDEYNETVKATGKSSKESQEAYNKLLQEQIDYAELQTQLSDAQKTMNDSNNEAFLAYNEYMSNADALLKQGFTMEEIQKAAAERTGYNPGTMQTAMQADVEESVDNAVKTTEYAYEKASTGEFEKLVNNSTEIGTSMVKGIATGIQNGASEVAKKMSSALQVFEGTISSESSKMNELGGNLVQYFSDGILNNLSIVATSAAEIIRTAIQSMQDTLASMLSMVNVGLEDELNPTITPVLDLSEVDSQVSKLDSIVSQTQAANISSGMSKTPAFGGGSDAEGNAGSPNFSFTQYNYSPKALSSIEIYRQSKNLFSSVGRAVSK